MSSQWPQIETSHKWPHSDDLTVMTSPKSHTVMSQCAHTILTPRHHNNLTQYSHHDITITSYTHIHTKITILYDFVWLYSIIYHHDDRSNSSGVLYKLMWMLINCFSFDARPEIINKYFNLPIDFCLQCCGCRFPFLSSPLSYHLGGNTCSILKQICNLWIENYLVWKCS